MSPIGLGLAASLGWGVSDFLAGVAGRRTSPYAIALATQAAGALLALVVLIAVAPPAPTARQLGLAALAGIAAAVGTAALFAGLAVGTMSLVAPMSAAGAVIPVAVGVAAGERPAALAWIGVALGLGGCALVGGMPGAARAGLGWAALAAVGFGVFFVLTGAAADDGALWAVNGSRITSVIALLVAAPLLRQTIRAGAPGLRLALPAGMIGGGAELAFAWATTLGLLSLVSVIASLYPVVTMAIARVVLGERLRPLQWLAAGLVLSGVGLISAAG